MEINNQAKEIIDLEKITFDEDDYPEIPPSDIIAYNELRSCADLYRMYTKGILDIQPEFQREIVWNKAQQTRFIDSLIKQLPIPSMCFSLDYKARKWKVIDGLQRMWTIIQFLEGGDLKLSKLLDIDKKISGQAISKFQVEKSPLHDFYTRVEDLTLPITVLRCDYSKKTHMRYLFTIFHRLNSGGVKLNNQEIRNCIYSGKFNNLLKELNNNNDWISINKIKSQTGYRFKYHELILRLFAFHDRYKSYKGRLAKFLNDYMSDYTNADENFLNIKRGLFEKTVNLINTKLFEVEIPSKTPITVLEALLVGVSLNIENIESFSPKRLHELFEKLISQDEFSEEKLKEGLAGKTRVIGRLSVAEKIFSGK